MSSVQISEGGVLVLCRAQPVCVEARSSSYRDAEIATGELLMRQALRRVGYHHARAAPLERRPGRRPSADYGFQVSLAHSARRQAAVAGRPGMSRLGIDLMDREEIDAAPAVLRRLRLSAEQWVAMEAAYKVVDPPGRLLTFIESCDLDQSADCVRVNVPEAGVVTVRIFECTGGILALATQGSEARHFVMGERAMCCMASWGNNE